MTMDRRTGISCISALLFVLALGAGASAWAVENGARSDALSLDIPAAVEPAVEPAVEESLEAQAAPVSDSEADLDPWENFNEPMFRFNREVDRIIVKPVAQAWDAALPDSFQRGLHNALDNFFYGFRRIVNNTLQGKFDRAGREVARFTINSTVGYVGFLDVARDYFGIQKADEDFGQTLAVWGAKSGPYLVLPLVPEPMTMRDGVGRVVDWIITPFTWIVPGGVTFGLSVAEGLNDRSLNLDRYQRVEESVVDLYSAVRNAYLQRRAAAIRE